MKQVLRAVAILAGLTLFSGCMSDPGLDDFNEISETSQGRAAMVEFVEPGVTTYEALTAQYGFPINIQALSGGGNTRKAYYSSYFAEDGYVHVYFDGSSRLISRIEAYRWNPSTEKGELEAAKP